MTWPADQSGTDDLRYYGVIVSNRAGSRSSDSPWRWSPPFATEREAAAWGREAFDRGDAVRAYVVRAEGKVRQVLAGHTLPKEDRKVLRYYLELVGLCEDDGGA